MREDSAICYLMCCASNESEVTEIRNQVWISLNFVQFFKTFCTL